MKIEKKTVYLPVDGETKLAVVVYDNGEHYEDVAEKEGYFFTAEELNEYTQNVIKQALETSAEKAEIEYDYYDDMTAYVNTSSIINTFEETFKKFEV